jgi:hypothetical protein
MQNAPSIAILLNNMFDGKSVDLKRDPSFFLDIKEQVIGKNNLNARNL